MLDIRVVTHISYITEKMDVARARGGRREHRRDGSSLVVEDSRMSDTTAAVEQLLSPEEVAERCSLSRKAVYRAIERGELRAARLCSRLRISPEDVRGWIDSNMVSGRRPSFMPPARAAVPSADGLRRLLSERDRRPRVASER